MNKTKKIVLTLAVLSLAVLPVLALAYTDPEEPTGGFTSFAGVFSKIFSLIWPIVGGIAVIMIIVAGILFMTAGGDPEKIATARTSIIWAIIGIVVAILAYSVPAIITLVMGNE